MTKNALEAETVVANRRLHRRRARQHRSDLLEQQHWPQAEALALGYGCATGEVYGLMSLIGAAPTAEVCALYREWGCPTLLDAFCVYLALGRLQDGERAA